MNVVVVGGGPGGLYAALLMKRRDPRAQITVVERNRPDDTFGWGVVLSDQTVANLRAADPESGAVITAALHRWDDIDVRFMERSMRSGGHGFSGVGRKRLLAVLQQRCRELGVVLRFQHELEPDQLEALVAEEHADLVIVSDGIKSRMRERFGEFCQILFVLLKSFFFVGSHKVVC